MSEPADIARILEQDRMLTSAQRRYDNMEPPDDWDHLEDCDLDEDCNCEQRLQTEADDAAISREESRREDRAYDLEHDRSWEP